MSDYDAIENFRHDKPFKQLLILQKVPSTASLRQRLEKLAANDLQAHTAAWSTTLLSLADVPITFSANLEAQRSIKNAEAAKVDAERAQAVAIAKLEAAHQQADDRSKALENEQQARRAEAEAHKVALAEQRDEWKERLASIEKQAQEARQQAQEAEKGRTKAEVRVEALAARLEELEAQKR